MAGRQRRVLASSAPGAHFLDSRTASSLVRLAGVGPSHLVLDLGAGVGAVTAPLAATGARVVAVERDPGYASRLRRRFAERDNVTVVQGDVREVPLPRRDFHVVANIPFATTAALLRRLVDPRDTRLVAAHLIVEAGAAYRIASTWLGRYEAVVLRRVPRYHFHPAPSVDAAILAITRRRAPAAYRLHSL